jgi:hypothetical protein
MAQPAAQTYLYDILSVHESNGGVPAGAPIDRQNLADAKSVAKGLRAMHGELVLDRINYFFTLPLPRPRTR